MGPNSFGPGRDAQSQAYFRREQAGDEASSIPAAVDRPSVVSTVDGGTSIPSRVDNPSGVSKGA